MDADGHVDGSGQQAGNVERQLMSTATDDNTDQCGSDAQAGSGDLEKLAPGQQYPHLMSPSAGCEAGGGSEVVQRTATGRLKLDFSSAASTARAAVHWTAHRKTSTAYVKVYRTVNLSQKLFKGAFVESTEVRDTQY